VPVAQGDGRQDAPGWRNARHASFTMAVREGWVKTASKP
jgi:hypothetical protein